VLPDRYPLGEDVETYVAIENGFGHMLDVGIITPRIERLYAWSAAELDRPALLGLLDDGIPAYAWPRADAVVWAFVPSMLARAARRIVPVSR
jgi:hypothetical protein